MIRLTIQKRVLRLPDRVLPDLCLELCGGGFDEGQVIAAMLLKQEALDKGLAKRKGFTLEILTNPEGVSHV